MKTKLLLTTAISTALLVTGCGSAPAHRKAVQDNTKDRITVGKVQREIKVGMSNAQVVEVLGAPNMVTTDDKRREEWVYDKVSTETAYSSSDKGAAVLILGFASSSGAKSTTQRTLTIIVKFDENSKVRDFAYRTSSF